MKIGLIRHFKVKRGFPGKMMLKQSELFQWLDEYEKSDIEAGEPDLGGVDWKRCYASDIPRAAKTAEIIYKGNIVQTPKLREIVPRPFFTQDLRLPFLVWPLLVKLAWMTNHDSQETRSGIEQRVANIIGEILAQGKEDALIVSHGAIMMFLRKELLARGFKGPKFGTPDNGKLYLFEN